MEPSVHRDPRIINIDDLRPLFGPSETCPLLGEPLRQFTSLRGSVSLSVLILVIAVLWNSRDRLFVADLFGNLEYPLYTLTSPAKSPFTPC